MRSLLLRNLLWGGPAAAAFLVILPVAARYVDRRWQLAWPLPYQAFLLAVVLIPVGLALAGWSAYQLAHTGRGTPNPMAPPPHLVSRGPYRYTRNPMMLGGWMVGFGLALALRSISLLVAVTLVIAAGCIYVRVVEEPRLLRRFGTAYEEYARKVPRWLALLLVLLFTSFSPVRAQPAPAVMVLIKFKPGAADQWRDQFVQHIVPAIRDAINGGDQITGFSYFENVVAGQAYDFALLIEAKSFAFFDRRSHYPHYRALYRRLGSQKAGKLLNEMAGWEQQVIVALVRAHRGSK